MKIRIERKKSHEKQNHYNQPSIWKRRAYHRKRSSRPCYDYELIQQISQKSGLAEEYIAEQGEDTPHSSWLGNMFTARSVDGKSTQDYLWLAQRKVILELAEKESCVIVGRCADFILKDAADCLKVFVHADMEKRAVCWGLKSVWR